MSSPANHVIKSQRVRLEAGPPISRTHGEAGKPHEKSVRLVHVDGEARAIELVCTCGEVTLIELTYEPESAPPAPTDP